MSAASHRSFLFLLAASLTGLAAADSGDDFSNNLFTDLAPLMALFGERVTMQFMSQSMGWADNIILAMAPLGIITAIISAIRVGGPSWLKALIGRARENLAVAETELMSSTSKEVCELWNGEGVVRCMGSAPIVEFICLVPTGTQRGSENDPGMCPQTSTKSLSEAIEGGYLCKIDLNLWDDFCRWRTWLYSRFSARKDAEQQQSADDLPQETVIIRNTSAAAPNISLNSHNQFWRGGLRIIAVFGTILQLGVLVYLGFATYSPTLRFQKDNHSIAGYAFPCVAAGTLILVIGVFLCAHVVESSTIEERYEINGDHRARLVWLQKTQTVSDQVFSSFAISASDDRAIITTSRRAEPSEKPVGPVDNFIIALVRIVTKGYRSFPSKDKPDGHNGQDHATILAIKAVLGTAVSLYGFIVQFIGLRGMHWSASIAQLGAVIVMTGLRAWVRRGLAKPLQCRPLSSGFELEWFAMTLGDLETAPWLVTLISSISSISKGRDTKSWRIVTGGGPETYEELQKTGEEDHPEQDLGSDSKAHTAMTIRRDLGRLAAWLGPSSAEAVSLATSIEITMNALFGSSSQSTFIWSVRVTCDPSHGQANHQKVKFRLQQQHGSWKIDADEVEAALSLWQFSVHKHCQQQLENEQEQEQQAVQDTQHPKDDAWRRATGSPAKRNLRLLGPNDAALRRDLQWWIPRGAARIIEVDNVSHGQLEVENHRVVVCGLDVELASQSHPQTRDKIKNLTTPNFDPTNIVTRDKGHALLATESHDPLKLLFAQDMFSAFMWAAAKTLQDPVENGADVRPNDSGNTNNVNAWKSFTLRNDGLSKMAEDVQSTGLGSLGQIYASIIPPLSIQQKLPQADAVIKWARQHAKPHVRVQNWKEAADVYLWLFRAAKTSDIAPKATAVLMEFLRMLVLVIDWRVAQDYAESDVRTLKLLKLSIENELANAGQSVLLSSLMRLFKTQGRGWKSGRLQKLVQADTWPGDDDANEMTAFAKNFHVYTRKEAADRIEELIPHKASIHARDQSGRTALHYAVTGGYEYAGVVKELLQQGASINAQDQAGRTPLHYAMTGENGDAGVVTELLQQGASPHTQDLVGRTPLHYAAGNRFQHLEMIRRLLRCRAYIHARDLLEWTPLHYAANMGCYSQLKYLLQHGASINAQDLLEWTPLHYAALAGGKDSSTQDLIRGGADISAQGINGQTPLHCAAMMGHKDEIASLVEAGAAINVQDASGSTPLLWAAYKGHTQVVNYLWRDANKLLRDGAGRTALHHAAASGHADVLELLLERGGDKTPRDRNGHTPLCLAGIRGHARIVELLIGKGLLGDAEKRDLDQMLHPAAANGHINVVALLIRQGVDMNQEGMHHQTPLHLASQNGQTHVVELLIAQGVDMDRKDVYDQTPLHLAIKNGQTHIAEVLIGNGVDKTARDHVGHTLVHLASAHGHTCTLKMLIQQGIDINAKDLFLRTPLHLTTAHGDTDIVEQLIERGADINTKDSLGRTPLHFSAAFGNDTIVKLLIGHGVEKDAKDKHGRTPLQLADALLDVNDPNIGVNNSRGNLSNVPDQLFSNRLPGHAKCGDAGTIRLLFNELDGCGVLGNGKNIRLNINKLKGFGIQGHGNDIQLNINELDGFGIQGDKNISRLNINELNGFGVVGDENISRLNINELNGFGIQGDENIGWLNINKLSGFGIQGDGNISRLKSNELDGYGVQGDGNIAQLTVRDLRGCPVDEKGNVV